MIELYQFELSHYSEKVRFILDYKGLSYKKIEVTPGLGQIDLYRMSGQRQVPVLKDGADIVTDSTAIALYLDRKYPEKPILPLNPQERALTLMLEEWADSSIGLKARAAMIGAFGQDPLLRGAFLPDSTPEAFQNAVNQIPQTVRTVIDRLPTQMQSAASRIPDAVAGVGSILNSNVPTLLRNAVGAVPSEVFSVSNTIVGFSPEIVKTAKRDLAQNLEALSLMLSERPYLVTSYPTLADFAVAALSMYIKFPTSAALAIPASLKGKGVPGLADEPAYATFFNWRDKLYDDVRTEVATAPDPGNGSQPFKISID